MSDRFYSQARGSSSGQDNKGFYTGNGAGSQDFGVAGLADLQKALDEFPDKLQRNVLRGAIRAALKVLLIEARSRVPVWLGTLRDSIRISVRIRDGVVGGQLKAGGNFRSGSGADKKRVGVFWAHMVEFGTAAHYIRAVAGKSLRIGNFFAKVVKHPGSAPKPFMRPTIAAKTQAATEAFAEYIRKRLDKLDQANND